MEIQTADPAMKDWIPPAVEASEAPRHRPAPLPATDRGSLQGTVILGVGSYLPERIVTNAELVKEFSDLTEQYVYQVTGIRQRHWAGENEKPSDMAYRASLDAIRKSGIAAEEIDAVILSTTTPDVAMPSTACILQERLELGTVPAFDLNAACSGWLYAVSMARGMIVSGMAKHVLTVGVDVQSRLLDRSDRNTLFIFGDAAGAAIISAGNSGHQIRHVKLGADTRGLHMARREEPGYIVSNGRKTFDPWIRLDGQALFRFAIESFADVIRNTGQQIGWTPEQTRWVIPHQANGRILKAAAKRAGLPLDRFYLNVERVGNTSSASILLALSEIEDQLAPGDKIILCSVGAGLTTAAVAVEW
jgi:3-oxoacyl-(acyl-carrier-protein) synthase III